MHLVDSNTSYGTYGRNLVFCFVCDHQDFLVPIEANGAVVMYCYLFVPSETFNEELHANSNR